MAKTPRITIYLSKIAANCQTILKWAAQQDIRLTGVVKGVAGDLRVADCLIASGLTEIGDSRLENLARFQFNPGVRRVLLRVPSLSRIPETLRYADSSLNSEITVLERLNACAPAGHEVMLMVDLGDLREGFSETKIDLIGSACRRLKNLTVTGIGTNFCCFAGALPTVPKLVRLIELARILKEEYRLPIQSISGGNSSSLPLLLEKTIPPGINHLRIGEGILLGRETMHGTVMPGFDGDAFLVEAEIIQAQPKPVMPEGPLGRNAFGQYPRIPEVPEGVRYLLNIGHQDTPLSGLTPCDPKLTILGGSSDYMVVAGSQQYRVGDVLGFRPNYWSLLALMTSHYVSKLYVD